tara:strand:- start:18689 stop:19087 length:399 start_codon:yes stop_codon:yes gene_type:complete
MTESKLFQYLKDNLVYPDLQMANNLMSRWDCYSPTTNHTIELKCRKVHWNNGLILERKKYDALIRMCKFKYTNAIYICSTPKGIFKWYLDEITPKWFMKKMKRTTEIKGLDNNIQVEKEVCFLKYEDAQKIG